MGNEFTSEAESGTSTPAHPLHSPITPRSSDLTSNYASAFDKSNALLSGRAPGLSQTAMQHSELYSAWESPPVPTKQPVNMINLIVSASHEMLLNNALYKYLIIRNQELGDANTSLNRGIGEIQGRLEQLKESHADLLQAVSLGSSQHLPLGPVSPVDGSVLSAPTPQPEDYPHLSFWNKASWAPYKQGQDNYDMRSNAEGISLYLEQEDGTQASKERVRRMADHQRSIWAKFDRDDKLPSKWRAADYELVDAHRTHMYKEFPELALCQNHYKLTLFASEHFSSYIRNVKKRKAAEAAAAAKVAAKVAAQGTGEDTKLDPADYGSESSSDESEVSNKSFDSDSDDNSHSRSRSRRPKTSTKRIRTPASQGSSRKRARMSPPPRIRHKHTRAADASRGPSSTSTHATTAAPGTPVTTSWVPTHSTSPDSRALYEEFENTQPSEDQGIQSGPPAPTRAESSAPRRSSILDDAVRRRGILAKIQRDKFVSPFPKPSAMVIPTLDSLLNMGDESEPSAGPSTSTTTLASDGTVQIRDRPTDAPATSNVMPDQGVSTTTTTNQPAQPGSVATVGPAPAGTAKAAAVRGASKLRVQRTSTTARNLCAVAYIKQHPKATTGEFTAYYDSMDQELRIDNEARFRFGLAHLLKNAAATAEEVVNAYASAPEDVKKSFNDVALAQVTATAKAKKPRNTVKTPK
ncbi:hypothetical protein TRAPUB_10051 [Trametes pubescens]|uniref:Uncharacterized protein n=1 Tax=Trametes pubescens TaxID=154538 RepID=A0A1M2VHR6_TRAPU|nr:hypothetical protein TRAPUB_2202 [Trametes pubescens]OJT07127.1 hypothetical protein TRAPUB_2018 [Trametes pubescens]OJT10779.1 hypothetical protein TRAPUB_12721 [Trametes pubescens]OJT13416.1 hypothetical protein TRAPUB_10051 [Trametes pubescens]